MGFDNVNVHVSGPKKDYTSTYKTYILRGNMDFASQVTEPNTKYVIKHNFELDSDVTIPENCVLEFDGGSISASGTSYILTINNTDIEAANVEIFKDVSITGTFDGNVIINWFSHAQDAVTMAKNTGMPIKVVGSCVIDEPMYIGVGTNIFGDSKYESNLSLSPNYTGLIKSILILPSDSVNRNITIKALSFSNADYAIYKNASDPYSVGTSIMYSDFSELYFYNIKVCPIYIRCYGLGVCTFNNIRFNNELNNYSNGCYIYIEGYYFNRNTISQCSFSGKVTNAALKIFCTNVNSNTIEYCHFESVYIASADIYPFLISIVASHCREFIITNCYFEKIYNSNNALCSILGITQNSGSVSYLTNIIITQSYFEGNFYRLLAIDAVNKPNIILVEDNGPDSIQKIEFNISPSQLSVAHNGFYPTLIGVDDSTILTKQTPFYVKYGSHANLTNNTDTPFIYHDTDYKRMLICDGGSIKDSNGFRPSPAVATTDEAYAYLYNLRNVLGSGDIGLQMFDKTINKQVYAHKHGDEWTWFDALGRTSIIPNYGATNQRLYGVMKDTDKGFTYFDTDLLKPIFWGGAANAVRWVDADGEAADIKRFGTFAQRPEPRHIGFCYFCTSGASIDGGTTEKLNIPIYYTGSDWVDANGNAVVAKS